MFNLTEANAAEALEPRWFKEYSFREYYGVPSCSPAVLGSMVTKDFFENQSLAQKVKEYRSNVSIFNKSFNIFTQYWFAKNKLSSVYLKKDFDDKTRWQLICEILMCN